MSAPLAGAGVRAADVRRMTFDDNALLALLYGNHDRHLVRIEQLANVQLSARGNQLAIAGAPDDAPVVTVVPVVPFVAADGDVGDEHARASKMADVTNET